MKKSTQMRISRLLILALFLCTLCTYPVDAQAATKYVDSYTKSYTLQADTYYILKFKVKSNSDVKITVTLTDAEEGHDYTMGFMITDTIYPADGASVSVDSTKTTIKGKLVKNVTNALFLRSYGADCKVKLKITTKRKVFSPGKLKVYDVTAEE